MSKPKDQWQPMAADTNANNRFRMPRAMPQWMKVVESNRSSAAPPPPPPTNDNTPRTPGAQRRPPPPPKSPMPEPDYEVIEFPTQQYMNANLNPSGNAANKNAAKRCDLCGSSEPTVTCLNCSNQKFCASCDDMYHRHPKRQTHMRRNLGKPDQENVRPPLPPKGVTAAPVPPPRRNKVPSRNDNFGGTLNRKMSTESMMDRTASLQRIATRPLPAVPTNQNNNAMRGSEVFAKPLINNKESNSALQQRYKRHQEMMRGTAPDLSRDFSNMNIQAGNAPRNQMVENNNWNNERWSTASNRNSVNATGQPIEEDNVSVHGNPRLQIATNHPEGMRSPLSQRALKRGAMSASVFDLNTNGAMSPPPFQPQNFNPMVQAQSMAQLGCVSCQHHMAGPPPTDWMPWNGRYGSNVSLNMPPEGYNPQVWMNPWCGVPMYPPAMLPLQHNGASRGLPSRSHSRVNSRAASPTASIRSRRSRVSRRTNIEQEDNSEEEDDRRSSRRGSNRSDRRKQSQGSDFHRENIARINHPAMEVKKVPIEDHNNNFRRESDSSERKSSSMMSFDQRRPKSRASVVKETVEKNIYPVSDIESDRKSTANEEVPIDDDALEGPPPPTPQHSWECEYCTYVNAAGTRVCDVCCKTPTAPPAPTAAIPKKEDPPRTRKLSSSESCVYDYSDAEHYSKKKVATPPGRAPNATPDTDSNDETVLRAAKRGESVGRNSSLQLPKHRRSPTPLSDMNSVEESIQRPSQISEGSTVSRTRISKRKSNSAKVSTGCGPSPPKEAETAKVKQVKARQSTTETQAQADEPGKKETTSTGTSPLPQSISTQTYDVLENVKPPAEQQIPNDDSENHETKLLEQPKPRKRFHKPLKRSNSLHNSRKPHDADQWTNSQKSERSLSRQSYSSDARSVPTTPPREESPYAGYEDFVDRDTKRLGHMGPMRSRSNSMLAANFGIPSDVSASYRSIMDLRRPDLYRQENWRPSFVDPFLMQNQRSDYSGYRGESQPREVPGSYVMDQFMQRRQSDVMKTQGMELVKLLREAELNNFSAEELQIAMTSSTTGNPITWLKENWAQMVETVLTVATNYGREGKDNTVGTISHIEAKEALKQHKGSVWQAVAECVEQRQKKFLELQSRGKFSREDILTCLTAHHGDVEAAFLELSKTQLKPFLMRIWGPPSGAENESGNTGVTMGIQEGLAKALPSGQNTEGVGLSGPSTLLDFIKTYADEATLAKEASVKADRSVSVQSNLLHQGSSAIQALDTPSSSKSPGEQESQKAPDEMSSTFLLDSLRELIQKANMNNLNNPILRDIGNIMEKVDGKNNHPPESNQPAESPDKLLQQSSLPLESFPTQGINQPSPKKEIADVTINDPTLNRSGEINNNIFLNDKQIENTQNNYNQSQSINSHETNGVNNTAINLQPSTSDWTASVTSPTIDNSEKIKQPVQADVVQVKDVSTNETSDSESEYGDTKSDFDDMPQIHNEFHQLVNEMLEKNNSASNQREHTPVSQENIIEPAAVISNFTYNESLPHTLHTEIAQDDFPSMSDVVEDFFESNVSSVPETIEVVEENFSSSSDESEIVISNTDQLDVKQIIPVANDNINILPGESIESSIIVPDMEESLIPITADSNLASDTVENSTDNIENSDFNQNNVNSVNTAENVSPGKSTIVETVTDSLSSMQNITSNGDDLTADSSKKPQLFNIMEDTQRLIQQMRDEIKSDIASYSSDNNRSNEESSDEYDKSDDGNETDSSAMPASSIHEPKSRDESSIDSFSELNSGESDSDISTDDDDNEAGNNSVKTPEVTDIRPDQSESVQLTTQPRENREEKHDTNDENDESDESDDESDRYSASSESDGQDPAAEVKLNLFDKLAESLTDQVKNINDSPASSHITNYTEPLTVLPDLSENRMIESAINKSNENLIYKTENIPSNSSALPHTGHAASQDITENLNNMQSFQEIILPTEEQQQDNVSEVAVSTPEVINNNTNEGNVVNLIDNERNEAQIENEVALVNSEEKTVNIPNVSSVRIVNDKNIENTADVDDNNNSNTNDDIVNNLNEKIQNLSNVKVNNNVEIPSPTVSSAKTTTIVENTIHKNDFPSSSKNLITPPITPPPNSSQTLESNLPSVSLSEAINADSPLAAEKKTRKNSKTFVSQIPKLEKQPSQPKNASKAPSKINQIKKTAEPADKSSPFGNFQSGHVKKLQQGLFNKVNVSIVKPTDKKTAKIPIPVNSKQSPNSSGSNKKDSPETSSKISSKNDKGKDKSTNESGGKLKPYFVETCLSDDYFTETDDEVKKKKPKRPEAPKPIQVIKVEMEVDPLSDQSEDHFLEKLRKSIDLSTINFKEDSPERQIRMLLAEGIVPSWEQAEVAVGLFQMKFDKFTALQAANECTTLEAAISYLQQECELCTGKYPMKEMISMLKCTHRCCKECSKNYFTIQITDRSIFDCICPFCKIPELHEQNEDEVLEYFSNLDILLKNILEENVHELFQRKLRDRTLMQDPNFKWCVECSSGFIANPRQKRLVCPDCRSMTCALCRKPWESQHDGLTCEKFAEWKESNDPDIQVAGVNKHLEDHGIDCPKCKFRFDLSRGGCMHFTCSQCKYEFCCGCDKPFMMGAKCGLSPYCARLGLHSHHPRNCLFYLRDKEPNQLQTLLQLNSIEFKTDIPLKVADNQGTSTIPRCPIQLQRETPGGLVDSVCNSDIGKNQAGLCKAHYVEYLVTLIHGVDPLPIMDITEMVAELRRRAIPLPDRGPWDTDPIYTEMCAKIIKEQIPLE